MAPQEVLGQSPPVAVRGENWPALSVPWPVSVQVRAAAIEVTTTSITTTTRAAGTRPTRTVRRTTLQQQRQPLQPSGAGWTPGVGASGTVNRCSSTTHLAQQLGSFAGHLFRYRSIYAQFEAREAKRREKYVVVLGTVMLVSQSSTLVWNVIFCTDVHVPTKMDPNDFGDFLT